MEGLVEISYLFVPLHFTFGYIVELAFHLGGKVIVHNIAEILHQEVVDHRAGVGRQQFALFGAGEFGLHFLAYLAFLEFYHIVAAFHAFFLAFHHIFALLYGGDGGRIGRRAAYTQLFEFLHQRSFVVAIWLLGEALGGCNEVGAEGLTHAQWRKHAQVVVGCRLFVGRLHIHAQETVEFEHFACSHKPIVAVRYIDVDSGLFYLGISHLRCYGALPYQVVEFLFLSGAGDVVIADIGGADGFVRLLCALRCCVIFAHLQILLSQIFGYLFLDGAYGKRRKIHRVGTHIGDMSRLIEHLCHAHGLRHGEAQLARCFLLQG